MTDSITGLRSELHDEWGRIVLDCPPHAIEMITPLLFDAGFTGFEEKAQDGRIRITAYYPTETSLQNPKVRFYEMLNLLPGIDNTCDIRTVKSDTIEREDWEVNWRKGLAAMEIGDRFIIRPSWIPWDNRDNRIEIVIDPKMAFGTGSHDTTRLCLEALERYDVTGKRIIDAGCGSGILSIAAVKLGAQSVFAFDHDPFSVDNANENNELNDASNRISTVLGDIRTVQVKPGDLVLANMISGVLVPNIDRFRDFAKAGAPVIFSGLLTTEAEMFTALLAKHGFSGTDVDEGNEWIAVTTHTPA